MKRKIAAIALTAILACTVVATTAGESQARDTTWACKTCLTHP